MSKDRMYAIVIKFPDENYLEGDDAILTRVLDTAFGIGDAYVRRDELIARFQEQVEITERSREYYIDIIAIPETVSESEEAIEYCIGKASYSYPV